MNRTASVISIHQQGAIGVIQSLLQQGINVRIQVSGNSMLPFLNGGETVELCPVTFSNESMPLKRGDLLLYTTKNNNPVIHRLVKRRYLNNILHIQTKGDNCAYVDAPVPVAKVLARVQSVEIPARHTCQKYVIDLNSKLMQLRGYMVASKGLFFYYLRRIKAVTKSLIMNNLTCAS